MIDTPDQTSANLLGAFIQKRTQKSDIVIEQAQQLVNLYRNLSLFGAGFVATYNKMLLEAPADVQMSLSNIMGGAIVRQYLEFLKGQTGAEQPESVSEETRQFATSEGYLPEPSADISPAAAGDAPAAAFPAPAGPSPAPAAISGSDAEQAQFLQMAVDQLQTHLTQRMNAFEEKHNPDKLQEMLNKRMEQVIQSQTEILTKTLQHLINRPPDAPAAAQPAEQQPRYSEVIAAPASAGEEPPRPQVPQAPPLVRPARRPAVDISSPSDVKDT